MPDSFNSRSVTVAELFSGSAGFQVPSFQRQFSWGEKEIGRLFDDLVERATEPESSECFLGSILLLKDRGSPAESFSFIIDGQQRLITLTILLATLRDILEEGDRKSTIDGHITILQNDPPVHRLRPRDAVARFFVETVQANGATRSPIPQDLGTSTTESLSDARNFIVDRVEALDERMRDTLVTFILNRCVLIMITSDQIDRAFEIFTVINDGGKDLSRAEILKAELLGKLEATRRAPAEERWLNLETSLGADFENVLGHFCTLNGRTRDKIVTSVRALASDAPSIDSFLTDSFFPTTETYAEIKGLIPTQPHRSRYFGYWQALNHENWLPATLAWMLWSDDRDADERFITALDRITVVLTLLGTGRDRRIDRYKNIIGAIKTGSALAPSSPLFPSRAEQRQALANLSRRFYKRGQAGCRLIMLRVNDHLRALKGDPPLGPSLTPARASIEHILPRNPADASIWRRWFADTDVRDYCTDALGNLVLISQSDNHRLKNDEFAAKKKVIMESADLPAFPVTAMIANYREWHPADVIRRDEQMIAMVAEIFDLQGPKGLETVGENRRRVLTKILEANS